MAKRKIKINLSELAEALQIQWKWGEERCLDSETGEIFRIADKWNEFKKFRKENPDRYFDIWKYYPGREHPTYKLVLRFMEKHLDEESIRRLEQDNRWVSYGLFREVLEDIGLLKKWEEYHREWWDKEVKQWLKENIEPMGIEWEEI